MRPRPVARPARSRANPAPRVVAYSGPPKSAERVTLQADGTTVVSAVGHDVQRPDLLFSEEAKAAPAVMPSAPTAVVHGTDPV